MEGGVEYCGNVGHVGNEVGFAGNEGVDLRDNLLIFLFFAHFKLKSSRLFAIFFIFVAEIAAEAVLFGEDLDEHDGEEKHPDKQSLPSPEPDDETSEVGERAGEHRVAVEAVGAVGHEVLRTRANLLAERVHRVAFAAGLHIDDGPDAETEAADDEEAGEGGTERTDMYCQVR